MNNNKEKKTLLGRQNIIITVFAGLVLALAVVYLVLSLINNNFSVVLPRFDSDGDLLEYSYMSENGDKVVVTAQDENTITLDADSKIEYSSRPFIYPEVPLENLSSITVKNKSDEYTLYLDSLSGEYLLSGNEMQLYQPQAISELRFQARYMLSIEKLDGIYNTDETLSAFGLDSASSPVTVTARDTYGNEYTVLIGNKLVSGDSYYAKGADKPLVYVLDSSVSVFFNDRNAYISPVIAPAIDGNNYQYIEEFCINKNGEPFIASSIIPDEQRQNTGNTDMHKLTYPAKYPASLIKYYEALSYLANLNGETVVETNILSSQDEEYVDSVFEKYGLTVPTNDVYYKYSGKEYRFLTGSRFTDELGRACYYVYSPYADTIVVMPLENAPFLEYELIDFIDANIFQMNITNVSEIEISTPSGSYDFILQGEGKNLTVIEKNTGKVVDVASFRQFFISLLSVKIDGYSTRADVTGNTELTFKVVTKFGEISTYSFDTISTTRALITLDGSSEFYTNRAYVTDVVNKLSMLISGETITAEY